jgi:hypothetical protein
VWRRLAGDASPDVVEDTDEDAEDDDLASVGVADED